MSLKNLTDLIELDISNQIQRLLDGQYKPSIELPRAARYPVLAGIFSLLDIPVLLITSRQDHALALMEEFALWLPDSSRLLFPEPGMLFYEQIAYTENTRRNRLNALTILSSYHIPGVIKPANPPIIIASVRSLMFRTMPRREFIKATRILRIGENISVDELLRDWIHLGYERVNSVIASGQYAHRGGILDIWPPASPQPFRIELFGNEIETLRPFDPATQRTIRHGDEHNQKQMLIAPAREYLESSYPIPDWWTKGTDPNEFLIPFFHPSSASLLNYLPSRVLIAIDDMQSLHMSVMDIEEQSLKLRQESIQAGVIPPDLPDPYLSWTEIEDIIESRPVINLGYPLYTGDDIHRPAIADMFKPQPHFAGQIKSFLEYTRSVVVKGEQVYIVSRQKARLEELWREIPTARMTLPTISPTRADPVIVENKPEIVFIHGSLNEGWAFTPHSGKPVHLLTDGEIFGLRPPEPRQRHRAAAEAPEAVYADLQAGDYVVHVDHGIGVFIGLVSRFIDGIENEYLCVEYANEAQLFVPVYQADRLTRYVGPDQRAPSLSRIGGNEWRTVKTHVKESVQHVAQELLDLYAHRSIVVGHSFSGDTPWQQELEASFPYIETEDQITVLHDVKKDMEAPRPMDRLICGDVGYGKTEVALRAAFKAVMDGKQVAVLVPTTILAQQHYDTFRQRLSPFPVTVEMLSRFRTPQQQQQIVQKLIHGAIDIIIGTHRLLSGDVTFKDLGLLIIDEEQRFGVTHKERLIKMRTEVDVLTLTATPIPRTLYMALTGVRDISTINTPPEERLSVVTHVTPYSPDLVRKAILRELERGGQVFFVHNRVQTISAMRTHLEKIVPEARIAIAHGQMPETELSVRMKQFTDGEIDVLLSTSIIESGLDIPNANTLIVDRAETFGLAQLYQLRGRVGRGAQRAYAYFFRHPRKSPTHQGRQRLETIAENTQLGAGFSIAMRDLEIRGTGDILGTRQSGHVAAVGFHLYTRLLSNAVHALKRTGKINIPNTMDTTIDQDLISVSVDLPLAVNLPPNYITNKNLRLHLYRRLANLKSLSELDRINEEFTDRFGKIPEPVENMFYQLKVKILAEKAGIASVSIENGQIALKFPDGNLPDTLPYLNKPIRVGKTAIWLPYATMPDWRKLLEETLEKLDDIRIYEHQVVTNHEY